jgi:hypothetical protein
MGKLPLTFARRGCPREMHVTYPRDPRMLMAGWQSCDAMLIADQPHGLAGYAALTKQVPQATVWVNDLVIAKPIRQTGVGSQLLKSGQWGRDHQLSGWWWKSRPRTIRALSSAEARPEVLRLQRSVLCQPRHCLVLCAVFALVSCVVP